MDTHVVDTNSSVVPQQARETNLVQSITAILARAGHVCPQSWIPFLPPAVAAAEADVQYQRFLINRYWRRVLGDAELRGLADTKQARFTLVETGTIDAWLNLFETGVVPCIVKNNLPITLN